MNSFIVDEILQRALKEDIGTGDITTISTVDPEKEIYANFIAKQQGVVCGIPIIKRLFEILDSDVSIECKIPDGAIAQEGDIIATVYGNASSILTGERVALNFLQRLSGIATSTSKAVNSIAGSKASITDTRKTTPGLRVIEKYAVRTGGGSNHRYNLSDGILIKDNHIKAAGGIKEAVAKARGMASHTLKIEVETENLMQVEEAIEANADIIMLDNMTIDEMKKAVEIIGDKAITEASGNMGEKDLASIAETGVDLISIGALTHTIKSMDISLKFVN